MAQAKRRRNWASGGEKGACSASPRSAPPEVEMNTSRKDIARLRSVAPQLSRISPRSRIFTIREEIPVPWALECSLWQHPLEWDAILSCCQWNRHHQMGREEMRRPKGPSSLILLQASLTHKRPLTLNLIGVTALLWWAVHSAWYPVGARHPWVLSDWSLCACTSWF